MEHSTLSIPEDGQNGSPSPAKLSTRPQPAMPAKAVPRTRYSAKKGRVVEKGKIAKHKWIIDPRISSRQ
eukprot:1411868-Prymnesium_polylepis.2